MTLIPNLTYSYLWFIFIFLIVALLVIFLTWTYLYCLHSNRTATNYANNFNISPDRQSPPVNLSYTPITNQRPSMPPSMPTFLMCYMVNIQYQMHNRTYLATTVLV